MSIKTKYLLALSCLCVVFGTYAQQEPTGEIEDVQVIIEKDKPLSLPKAGRLYEKTQVKKVTHDTVSLKYTVSQPQFNFSPYTPSFEPRVFKENLAELRLTNYVKAGFGNYQSPLLETFVGIKKEENSIGLWFKHESFGTGSVRDEASGFSQNQLIIDGQFTSQYFKVKPILQYEREGFYYYGYDDLAYRASSMNFSDRYFQDRAVYENWSAGGTFIASPKEELSLSLSPIYHRTAMKFKGSEAFGADNGIELNGQVGYTFSSEMKLNTGLGYHWSQYTGNGGDFSRSRAFLNPTLDFNRDKLNLKAGFKLIGGSDSSSQIYFYPDIQAKYALSEQLSITAIIGGDLEMNTLATLYNQNKYLDDSLALVNTNRALVIKGIVSGKISEQLLLEGFAGYDVIKNQTLFKYSTYDTSRFTTKYDTDFGRFQLGVKASYIIESSTQVTGAFTYFAYKSGSEAEAWFLPLSTIEVGASHRIIDQLTAKAKLMVLGEMKAPYVNVLNDATVAQQYRSMTGIYDLSLGLDYAIKENIGAFIQLNNVFTKEYERYLNYPTRGISVKVGGVFRF
jgi:hypothetical protein